MFTFLLALTPTSVMAQSETGSQPASPAETKAEDSYRFLVAPFIGFRSGGSFTAIDLQLSLSVNSSAAFGAIFDYRLNDTSKVEFIWSRQTTDLTPISVAPVPPGETAPPIESPPFDVRVQYFHGAYVYGGGPPRFQPYVAVGAGIATFSSDDSGVEGRTKFSFSIGTGFRSFLTERVGVLVDARAFGTRAGDDREDIMCGVFGCVSFETGATFWQGQVVGGVVFAF
jgi:hypothetical protein